jgi:lactonase
MERNYTLLNEFPPIPKMPLPPELAGLPTIEAKVKYRIADGKATPSIEGPIFDRSGNLYVCHTTPPTATIKKITPSGEITDFFHYDKGMLVATAVHKDGRIFAADFVNGMFVVLSPDGEVVDEITVRHPDGGLMKCDDMVFDSDGNLYFTDFNGTFARRTGGVYRLDAESNYRTQRCIMSGIGAGNGISFSPDFSVLWVADTPLKTLYRIVLDNNGNALDRVFGILPFYQPYGRGNPDSNKVDADGNLYQAMMHAGLVIIYNSDGIPVANVVVPGREDGRLLNTPNLAIIPGKKLGYMVASDEHDVVVLEFPTLAPGETLYSHM